MVEVHARAVADVPRLSSSHAPMLRSVVPSVMAYAVRMSEPMVVLEKPRLQMPKTIAFGWNPRPVTESVPALVRLRKLPALMVAGTGAGGVIRYGLSRTLAVIR